MFQAEGSIHEESEPDEQGCARGKTQVRCDGAAVISLSLPCKVRWPLAGVHAGRRRFGVSLGKEKSGKSN